MRALTLLALFSAAILFQGCLATINLFNWEERGRLPSAIEEACTSSSGDLWVQMRYADGSRQWLRSGELDEWGGTALIVPIEDVPDLLEAIPILEVHPSNDLNLADLQEEVVVLFVTKTYWEGAWSSVGWSRPGTEDHLRLGVDPVPRDWTRPRTYFWAIGVPVVYALDIVTFPLQILFFALFC